MQEEQKICEACLPDADNDIQKLSKVFTFANFIEAQNFTNKVANMAEKEGHHPSITLEYGRVTVKWWSHKIKGIHEHDLKLSEQTDRLLAVSAA